MRVHAHGLGTGSGIDVALAMLAVGAIAAYVAGVACSRRRGRAWPVGRAVLWCCGIAVGAASVIGPLADAAHESFVAHAATHLLAGMIAPALLVLAAPVTLALRSLAPTPARRVSRLARSGPARVVAHPITATVLNAGGLWLVYLTPVVHAMRDVPLVHVLVHAHLLLAGCLFTAAIIGIDPRPHPPRPALVAGVLVLAMAAHAVLAKLLYANPPAGFAAADVRAGAQLMYYGGAWVEAVVVVIFCARWYRAAAPRTGHPLRLASGSLSDRR